MAKKTDIIENLRTAIKGDSYFRFVGIEGDDKNSLDELSNFQHPSVLIRTGDEFAEDGVIGNTTNRSQLNPILICRTKDGHKKREELNKIESKVKKLVLADPRRSGNAIYTRISDINDNLDTDLPYGEIEVELEILYDYDRSTGGA